MPPASIGGHRGSTVTFVTGVPDSSGKYDKKEEMDRSGGAGIGALFLGAY
jgi:hypothetical protein